MAEIIWQQQINKIIKETLTITADLPELGRVTSINVFSEVLRGEIYRGSMVVQGNIKCEIYYATKSVIDYDEALDGEQFGVANELTDLAENDEVAEEEPYFEENLPEEELWGAEDLEPDLEKEPIYCLVHNLVYRVPVEIPRLEPGQNFEFKPGVDGVKYEIIDPRTLDTEVGLNIDLYIYGEKIEVVSEPAAEVVPEPAAEVVPEVTAESEEETAVPAKAPSELDQILEQAVKEIEEGVEAVLSGRCKKGQTEQCSEEQIHQAMEKIKESVEEIVDEIIEEENGPEAVEVAAQNIAEELTEVVMEDLLEDFKLPAIEEVPEELLINEESPVAEEAAVIEELTEAEEVSVIEELPVIDETPETEKTYQPKEPVARQGAVIKFNGTKDLAQTGDFQNQKLVPVFRVRFNQGAVEFSTKI